MQPKITPSQQFDSKSNSDACIVTLASALTIPLVFLFLILLHFLSLYDKLALLQHNMSFTLHFTCLCGCVCVCAFQSTHPLGPGLCPCVKRQSLLGGFCCEENRRCNMNWMRHCDNRKTFPEGKLGSNDACLKFVADACVIVYVFLSAI